MRILVAALLGAIVLFVWGFVAHMFLPIGEMGMRQPTSDNAVLAGVKADMTTPGIYMLPSLESEKWTDEAAMAEWAERAKNNPYVYAVVADPLDDPTTMTPQLIKQFSSNFLGAVLVAWILGATTWSFGMRVLGAAGMGVFAWLSCTVPMWNWYRFPTDFLIGGLLENGVGWLLAGIAIAWRLGRK